MSVLIEKIIAIILSLTMALGSGVAGSQIKNETKTETTASDSVTVGSYNEAVDALTGKGSNYVSAADLEKDEVYPTIIIHGIGQAKTYLVDDSGNKVVDSDGKNVTSWPLYFNAKSLVLKLAYPLLRTLITQKDNGFCDTLYDAVYDALSLNAYNDDGTPKNDIEVEQYDNRPVSECNQEEKDHIYGCVPIQAYTQVVGEQNLYYFAYNSFGDTYQIVDQLKAIIEKAKADTGKDKVNLVPISLGGAISAAYFNENKTGEGINKVVFIVPALNGSEIVGKVMAGQIDYSDEGLYKNMFTKLVGVDDYTGWMINVAIRALPKQEIKNILSTVADAMSDSLLSRCINMWGLVPGNMYEELADKYLTDGTVLREEADRFHEAQTNVISNLKTYQANGVSVYDICGYGLQLYSLIDSDSNSDKIIHSTSTSMGATFSKFDSTLGSNYTQKYYNDYDMISPDDMVDASTCAFPFTTWYFGGQDHEKIGRNDVVVSLAATILISKNMDIYSTQDYPQFNGHRNTRELKEELKQAQGVDMSTLSAENASALQKAMDAAQANLNTTVIVNGESENVQAQLESELIKIGVMKKEDKTKDTILLKVFRGLSNFLYDYYGPRGFTDKVTTIG